MDLTKLVPKKSKLHLKEIGQDFELRPFNLSDEIWLRESYGDRLGEIFELMDFEAVSRIAFHQIIDKSYFKKREVEFITEDGDTENVQLGGVELFRQLVKGWDEKIEIMSSVIECITGSRPELENEDKKKAKKSQKGVDSKGETARIWA